jgi:hypothetical protein
MSACELIAIVGALALVAVVYVGYWASWCWVWHYAWPAGPEWFIRPRVTSFLLATITCLIITLVICSKASE